MKSRWILGVAVLGLMVPLWTAQAADLGNISARDEKKPGDKRKGEEEEIRKREEWFAHQRGLEVTYRPGELRKRAVEELRLSLSRQLSQLVGFSWQPLGPSPMNMMSWLMGRVAGRVSSLAIDPATEQTIYLGTASGGLWKSVDGGSFWSPLFDAVGTETIGSVAVDPNNSNVVWVGTGEQVVPPSRVR